ncbi:MAG: ATP-binding cassette domain-containing protein [Defluviitaleaceae bacterium]|nr:ATP-binding cassette domain-containing protein [Defluviitaleaceae bacterium]MCL2262134.1 ATP-binding cassette domain-containing protein [Defluviitaleaceae bacterium]
MNVIEVSNLTKTYTTHKRGSGFGAAVKSLFVREKVEVCAVDDISFTVKKGSICGLLGPNGAGKSTTIKMLCGALYPTGGKINSLGFNPYADRKKYVRKIGAVFGQRSQLVWDIPPVDSFNMNRAIYAIPAADYKKRLSHLAALFEIQDVMQKPTRVLSLGERMKCEFIMAMLHNPEIVFLDEPTIGLDILAKTKIREFIREINAGGTTFILTTHDLEDVQQLAEHIIIINHGKKVFDDTLPRLQHYVGERKIIELKLNVPLTIDIGKELNARIIKQPSPVELTLEVDTASTPIGEFIAALSRKTNFADIAIKALPMEEIISQIYSE